ncbi:hypothetical protein Nepgr_012471 [Nepenthes gracilis]|uniref:Peptidase A1 domain-containing protein n=1 Tax=Nepenthes gracilis TaxID=150966 RepID=A0AAD3SGZ2_NEPGR|nr:hypothetical protein Nepgr_012471 [Nepenthes gracilis]
MVNSFHKTDTDMLRAVLLALIFFVSEINGAVALDRAPAVDEGSYAANLRVAAMKDQRRYEMMSRVARQSRSRGRNDLEKKAMGREELIRINPSNAPAVKFPMYAAADFGLGEYMVDAEFGTPPQKVKLIVDTGSDLTWIKCAYNEKREEEKQQPFVAQRSSTFKTITCGSRVCMEELAPLFSLDLCPGLSSPCMYNYSYHGDAIAAFGMFGKEVARLPLTDGTQATLLNVLGCTEAILGSPILQAGDGILGLNFNMQSFGYRAATKHGRGKFSYCLVDNLSSRNVTSYLVFGDRKQRREKIAGKMRYTELALGVVGDLYALNVKGISIGRTMLRIPPDVWELSEEGGALIDSGTTLTLLAPQAYDAVTEVLVAALSRHLEKVEEGIEPFEYCYHYSAKFDQSLVPRLEFHFKDGARFKPHVKSYIIDVRPDTKCIGILKGSGSLTIFGNIMQQNYLWEYDLFSGRLGFAPSTCI